MVKSNYLFYFNYFNVGTRCIIIKFEMYNIYIDKNDSNTCSFFLIILFINQFLFSGHTIIG